MQGMSRARVSPFSEEGNGRSAMRAPCRAQKRKSRMRVLFYVLRVPQNVFVLVG